MELHWDVIGAPSSAGAHTPGVERAPAALREAGLVDLMKRGSDVTDLGDVPGFRWRPDPSHARCQNAREVVRVAASLAEQVAGSVQRHRIPLILGGDCTVTIGLVAGHTKVNGAPALLPAGDHEYDLVEELFITHVPAEEVHADAAAAATRARAAAEAAAPAFVVHFDVDVLSFVEAPLADVPEPFGLTLPEASTTLTALVASSGFAGLTVMEINPDHLPDQEILPLFTRMLTAALARR
jgi:arginase